MTGTRREALSDTIRPRGTRDESDEVTRRARQVFPRTVRGKEMGR